MAEQEIVSPGEFSPVLPQYSSLFRYNISYIGPLLGGFHEILSRPSPLGYFILRGNIKGLLTECEVCTGRRGFRTDWATKERGLCEKHEGKDFPVQTEQTRLIRLLLYGFWFIFFFVFSAVFISPSILPLSSLVLLHVYTR